jgi:hypothetical protein
MLLGLHPFSDEACLDEPLSAPDSFWRALPSVGDELVFLESRVYHLPTQNDLPPKLFPV